MGAPGDAPAEHPPSPPPAAAAKRTLVFTYGTLKRGFSNHALLQDLFLTGDAAFAGAAATASPLPLVCGPYRVPFLLNLPGSAGCHRVKGELYSVTARGLARLDELEGVSRGHYERLPVEVVPAADEGAAAVEGAVAYYAHRGYAAEMWARSGRRGHAEYSPAVAAGYVRRVDRPQGQTFLEQIRVFVSSQS
ncbi:putative gamma-glutamylcyclotransferase At3g02910 [Lolium rigidum]|uniref:putative gamma-glutamylcyclotransferase At3g02910 n=1 Tax=Lolium rigidum TaxID=89674 RepID=UPI001F5D2AAF|nr:putative gamma-glutamylcyclotransferase At3g02910 [Lolium rigidum]